MIHENHRDRMRERILAEGVTNLQEHEVLEYLLYPYIPRKDTNPIAHELINKFGSLSSVLDSTPQMLVQVPNMTQKAAEFLVSLPGVFKKYNLSKYGPKPNLSTYSRVKEYCKTLLSDLNSEAVYMLAVDNKGSLIEKSEIGQGGISDCRIATRKMVMMCHNLSAPNIYITHNHPSGTALPSVKDMEFTKWAAASLEMMGVRLVDHIIVARENVYSFAQNGKLDDFRDKYYQFMSEEKISDRK